MKKVLSLLLILVLMLTLAASCGGGGGDTATPTAAPTSAPAAQEESTPAATESEPAATQSETVETASEPAAGTETIGGTGTTVTREPDPRLHGWTTDFDNYGLSLDPITVTANIDQATMRHAGPINSLSDFMLQYATGITIDFIGVDDERFNLMVAGDDLPDIIFWETVQTQLIIDMITTNRLVNMEPLLSKYGANLNPVMEGTGYDWIKWWCNENAKADGIYFLPNSVINVGDYQAFGRDTAAEGFLVRLDIYNHIGKPPIMDANGFNEDMLLDVLLQMQNYARANGNPNAYAISGWVDWGIQYASREMYQRNMSNSTDRGAYYDYLTHEFTPPMHDKSYFFWDNARFNNKAYRMGIFDDQSFVQAWWDVWTRLTEGDVLTAPFSWMWEYADDSCGGSLNADYPEIGGYLIKGTPYVQNVFLTNQPIGLGTWGARSINVKSPHIDRIMAMLDYASSAEYLRDSNGAMALKGVHWDYDETGMPRYINEKYLALYGTDEEKASVNDLFQVGEMFDYGQYGGITGVLVRMHPDGFLSGFQGDPKYLAMFPPANKHAPYFLQTFDADPSLTLPNQLYESWINEGIMQTNQGQRLTFNFVPVAPEELAGIQERMNQYIDDNEPRLVLAATEEEFERVLDEMTAHLLNMGSDRVYEDAIKRLNESKAIAASITG